MTSSRSVMQEVAPHLAELSSSVLFGDIWERPGLSKRDRSLVTMVTMIASIAPTSFGASSVAPWTTV